MIENGIAFSHGTVLDGTGAHIPGASHKKGNHSRRWSQRQRWGTPVQPYRLMPPILEVDGPLILSAISHAPEVCVLLRHPINPEWIGK